VILHKAYFTYHYLDQNGNKKEFDTRKVNIYKSINKLLDHYYHFFEQHLPSCKVIELPRDSYLSWAGHEWGLAPMHYESSYYQRILEQLDQATATAALL
jgi:hypothetical protein